MTAGRQTLWSARLLAMVLATAGVGCASAADTGDRRDPDLISREDLAGMDHLSAFDAVRRLRPAWLQAERGQDSFVAQGRRGTRIYLNGVPYGDKASLRSLGVREIESIRFLDKREATTRWGIDHAEGVILVTTRKG
ncbi:MAG: hypothetical protein P8177_07390 [Gemmatimonadota bacterium]